jgi:hypothetical protein
LRHIKTDEGFSIPSNARPLKEHAPVDPIYGASNFEREEGDRYWTEPWVPGVLLNAWDIPEGRIWEPAAGRGDIVGVLQDFGFETFASDIDMSEYLGPDPCGMVDFLNADLQALLYAHRDDKITSIITNPPYKGNLADDFVAQALHLMEDELIETAAFLLRAEWNAAKKRAMFFDHEFYAGEVVLRKRPRWDWWYTDKSEHGPRHNFSWFVWDRREHHMQGVPLQLFQKVDE